MPTESQYSTSLLPPPWCWTKRIAKFFVLLLILLSAIRWGWGRYADAQLNRAMTENRRPGEPFSAEDFKQPPIPDSENAAVILQAAAESVQTPGFDFGEFETVSGTDNALARLWLISNASALTQIRAARSTAIDWKTDFSHGINGLNASIRMTGLYRQFRQLADLTLLAAKTAHYRQDDAETVECWSDMLCEARIIRRQPTWLSYTVADRVDETACLNIIDRAAELQVRSSREAISSRISMLIVELRNEENLDNAVMRAFCTERWKDLECWRTAINGNLLTPFGQDFQRTPGAGERAVFFSISPTFKLKSARNMKLWSATLHALNAPDYRAALAQMPKWPPPIQTTLFTADHAEAFGDHRYNFTKFVEPVFRLRLDRRAAAMALALQLYRADHGGVLPENASLLVPKYLPSLPLDPFDSTGQPIRYAPTKFARPLLYSVGPSGRDLAFQNWKLPAKRLSNSDAYSYVFEISPPFRGTSAPK